MKFVYFDTETTGFKPGQIGQLSVIVEENEEVKAFNYFFEVKHIDADVTEKLGRDVEFYKVRANGEVFKDKATEIQEMFNGAIFVAHNLKFDETFLSSELWKCGLTATPSGKIDTMTYYKPIIKAVNMYGRLKNPKLIEVVQGLNLNEEKIRKYSMQLFKDDDNIDYHDSRYDTTVVYVISQIAREFSAGLSMGPWYQTFIKQGE